MLDKYREKEKDITQNSAYVNKNIAELKSQKAMTLDILIATKEPSIRAEIEQLMMTSLQKRIHVAEQERDKLDITEKDIHNFIAYGKYLIEHLEKLLLPQGA